jgi:hypothetical protein
MTNHQVTVTYNGEGVPLSIDNSITDLSFGDTIQWNFPGLPPGLQGYIYFNDPPNQPFGPFVTLQSSSGNTVTGSGNSGIPNVYSYTALVWNQSGPVASSQERAIVNNLSDMMDTVSTALAWVFYTPGDPPVVMVGPARFRPGSLKTLIWLIENVPEDFFVTFHFYQFADSMTGPFSTFSISRAFGTTRLAVGTDFGAGSRTTGSSEDNIPYFVEVRDSQGVVVASSHDPVIEPLGTPPNP